MAETKVLELGNTDSPAWEDPRASVPSRRNNGTEMKKWKKVTLAIVAIPRVEQPDRAHGSQLVGPSG